MRPIDVALGVHLLGTSWLQERVQRVLRRQLYQRQVIRRALSVEELPVEQIAVAVLDELLGRKGRDGA